MNTNPIELIKDLDRRRVERIVGERAGIVTRRVVAGDYELGINTGWVPVALSTLGDEGMANFTRRVEEASITELGELGITARSDHAASFHDMSTSQLRRAVVFLRLPQESETPLAQ